MSRSEGERQVTDRVVDFDKAKQKPTEVKKARRLKSMQKAFADYRSEALGQKKSKSTKASRKKKKKGRKGR